MLNGKWIGVKEEANVFVLEKKFFAGKAQTATLRATALGVYFARINGMRVGDAYLAPGWTSYNKMLQVQTYDVTELLQEGENVLQLTVGEGWYCGGLTWQGKKGLYGKKSAVCAELIADGETVAVTDENWQAKESFIRFSSIYDGETQDLTADCARLTPCEVEFDKTVLTEQICQPVRTTERLSVREVIRTPKGELVYDFGQNIAGVAEIKTPEGFAGTITLQFAEILVKGNFYTENLRSAKATDRFIVQGAHTLSPEFTFHGFRYMKMEGAELPAASVTALVRHTDMPRTGKLETDNARFNRLIENVVWGQRGNFVDIPTDCPQRDERLGWTGDINAFCRTAAYQYDVRRILKKWLADVRNDQSETGKIPHVVPDVLGWKDTDAMWCDAVTMVPWTLYEMYGDLSFLSENFSAMKKFIAAREQAMVGGLVAKGHEYGDWLALDREILMKEDPVGRTDVYYLTNVLHLNTLHIAENTAKLLGEKESAKEYAAKRRELLKKIRAEYITPNGRLALDTVTAQVLALHFGIIPEAHRAGLAAALDQNVKKHGFHVTTGFIGTPFLLYALADNGYFETACRVLLNGDYPGWLYEVDMGATTVWERWNSLLPDGTPNPDGMNSYNHYAYGSVLEFVYRRIAGLEAKAPGFKQVKYAPHPCEGLGRVRAEYDSVYGKIVAGYQQKDGKTLYFAEIPQGVTAQIALPNERPFAVKGGKYAYERPSLQK